LHLWLHDRKRRFRSRRRGDTRFGGSDWLIGKSHDTFAPMGPFIVPREFVTNPQTLPIKVLLNGKLFQEGTSADMIHDVYEQVEYASNIMTLRPGDVIATGTPPGVGSAKKPPVFFKAGDSLSCNYDGIGTLVNPVVGPQPTASRRPEPEEIQPRSGASLLRY